MAALPDEIYIAIFQFLSLRDVVNLRQVSHHFGDITKSRELWNRLLRREIHAKRRIPVPGLEKNGIGALSARELEICVQRSLKLHRNWTSESPVTTRTSTVSAGGVEPAPSMRVISLDFITVEGLPHLFSASLRQDVAPRMFMFELWAINLTNDSGLHCVARRESVLGGGYAVNRHRSVMSGTLAIKSAASIDILGLDPSKEPEQAFVTLNTIESSQAKSVLSFIGTTLVIRGLNDEVRILDTTRPTHRVELRHPQPVLPANQPKVFETVIDDDYILLIQPTTLELYSLEGFRNGDNVQFLSPITVHTFQWRLDSCRVERDIKHAHVSHPSQPPPINILLRFSSLFPWPVNLLQHYVLHPNRHYTPSIPVSLYNLPYHFPPILQQTISSPIRLFAVSDVALGSYGTGVWIDSHTEDYFHQGEVGQRLAGHMLSPVRDGPPAEGRESSYSSTSNDPEQPEFSDKSTQSQASTVYYVQETDDWTRVAVDEAEGRIAVGSALGRIVLYDYAERA
ncbi:hypothetical protein PM082_023480 [Marasmius tenuissimus]|nr:hypothetical protein PM082_023480 [Marasmius tenuissimus]